MNHLNILTEGFVRMFIGSVRSFGPVTARHSYSADFAGLGDLLEVIEI
jgi:hypothetical protein